MKRIIVIDDSEVNLFLIQTIFENDPSIEVKLVAISIGATDMIRAYKPHLVILDLMMPHVSGYDILDEIRNDEKLAQLPVLIISARYDKESIEAAYDHGATNYLVKPIKLDVVKEYVENMLSTTEMV